VASGPHLSWDSKAGFGVWSRGDGDAVDGEQEIGAPAGSVQRKRRVQRKKEEAYPGKRKIGLVIDYPEAA